MTSSPKTRLRWRLEQLRLLGLAVVLFWLWLSLLLAFLLPGWTPVLLVSAGAFVAFHLTVWVTRFLAVRKQIAD